MVQVVTIAAITLQALLPSAATSMLAVDYQTTVFSRDWLTGAENSVSGLSRVGEGAGGSPWCEAGCIPNGSLLIKPPNPPKAAMFRAPSLVQLSHGPLLAISTDRNGSASRLQLRQSSDEGRSWGAKQFITGTPGWGPHDQAHIGLPTVWNTHLSGRLI